MAKSKNPPILVITEPLDDNYRGKPRFPNLQEINIDTLQSQVTVFLQQINHVMETAPETVGKFHLDEFEVSVGLVAQAEGEVKLALIANAKAGGEINAGFKFVFKR